MKPLLLTHTLSHTDSEEFILRRRSMMTKTMKWVNGSFAGTVARSIQCWSSRRRCSATTTKCKRNKTRTTDRPKTPTAKPFLHIFIFCFASASSFSRSFCALFLFCLPLGLLARHVNDFLPFTLLGLLTLSILQLNSTTLFATTTFHFMFFLFFHFFHFFQFFFARRANQLARVFVCVYQALWRVHRTRDFIVAAAMAIIFRPILWYFLFVMRPHVCEWVSATTVVTGHCHHTHTRSAKSKIKERINNNMQV